MGPSLPSDGVSTSPMGQGLVGEDSSPPHDCLLESAAPGDITSVVPIVLSPGQDCCVPPISHNLFNSVRHLYVNDRASALEERRKNLGLMAFISSLGHSAQDVNSVLQTDGINSVNLAHNLVTNVPILFSRPVRRNDPSTSDIVSPKNLGPEQSTGLSCVEAQRVSTVATDISSVDFTPNATPPHSPKLYLVVDNLTREGASANEVGACNLFVNSPNRAD